MINKMYFSPKIMRKSNFSMEKKIIKFTLLPKETKKKLPA